MDKLGSERHQELEKHLAGEVNEVKKGKGQFSLNKLLSTGVEMLDKVPPQYITGRSAKNTRKREQ